MLKKNKLNVIFDLVIYIVLFHIILGLFLQTINIDILPCKYNK